VLRPDHGALRAVIAFAAHTVTVAHSCHGLKPMHSRLEKYSILRSTCANHLSPPSPRCWCRRWHWRPLVRFFFILFLNAQSIATIIAGRFTLGWDNGMSRDPVVRSGLRSIPRPDRPKTKTVVWSRSWGGLGQTRPMDVVMVVVVKHMFATRGGARW
jgi:hypothetical protein